MRHADIAPKPTFDDTAQGHARRSEAVPLQ